MVVQLKKKDVDQLKDVKSEKRQTQSRKGDKSYSTKLKRMERRKKGKLVRVKRSCVDGSRNRVHLQNFIFVVNHCGYFDSFAPSGMWVEEKL